MNRLFRCLCLPVFFLLTAFRCAALIQDNANESVILEKNREMSEQAKMSSLESLSNARRLQEKSQERAKALHRLPPALLRAWAKGEIEKEEIMRLADEQPDFVKAESSAAETVKHVRNVRIRFLRLGGIAILCLILYVFYRRQRRSFAKKGMSSL